VSKKVLGDSQWFLGVPNGSYRIHGRLLWVLQWFLGVVDFKGFFSFLHKWFPGGWGGGRRFAINIYVDSNPLFLQFSVPRGSGLLHVQDESHRFDSCWGMVLHGSD
jgi:hypothetical protein